MNEIVKIILSVHLCFLVLCLALYIDQHDTTIWFHAGYYYVGFWTGIVIYFMGTEAQKRAEGKE